MSVTGFHFVGTTLCDGRPVPADGEWLEHTGPVAMCESGLHGSPTPWDALQYAPGATLCWCEFEQIEAQDKDKFVARRRRILARFDATDILRKHARESALSVIHLWNAPAIVREYLETGDETKRGAASAASAAAWAAWDAASAAARDVAWAARDAARDAASAASAAWDAAWGAAGAAAWDAWDAARGAAGAARAAWDADRFNDAVHARFTEICGSAP